MIRPTSQILSTNETQGGRKANLSVAVVQNLESMDSLRSDWDGLVEADGDTSPFNRFGWYEAWCRTFVDADKIHILTVHENGVLIGGLWLYRQNKLGSSHLKLAGEAWAGGDYLDLVAGPDQRDLVAFALAVTLKESTGWKILDLNGMAERSPLPQALKEACEPEGWAVEISTAEICPRIDHCTIEDWENAPDRVFKRIVAKSEKQTGNKVNIELEDSFDLAPEQAARWIADLKEWSIANWRRRQEVSCFENPLMKDFYDLQAAATTDRTGPAMHRLLVDGEPAAIVFGLWKGPDFYFLQSGISPLGQEYRAGNLLLNRMLRRCIGQSGRFFFLRGDEVYKYRWGARDTHTLRVLVSRSAGWFALRNLWGTVKVPLKKGRDVMRRARTEGSKSTISDAGSDLKARFDQGWEVTVFRIQTEEPLHEKLIELARAKNLKKIACGPMDESDLIQIRLGRGRDLEDAYRTRLESARGYCSYQGGNLVASAWVTDRPGKLGTAGRPDLQADPPDGAGIVFDLWMAPGTDGGAAGKLLAHILETEAAKDYWLALDSGTVAQYLEEAGFPSIIRLKARRTLGRLSAEKIPSEIPVRFST